MGSTPEPAAGSREPRRRGRRLRGPAATTGVSRPRRMRGLLVTPWFAAGAGFVIAAGLALNSPHTVLTYRPGTEPCVGNCAPAGQSKGSTAEVSPGVQIKTASPARPGSGAHAHHGPSAGRGPGAPHHGGGDPSGAGIGFRVLFHKYGHFSALITIPATQARHGWSLEFTIPDTQITKVWGAQWQPSASDGGLATMLGHQPGSGTGSSGQGTPGTEGTDGPGPGWPGWQQWQGHHGWWPADGNGFLVVGQGRPGTPVGCLLNRAVCHFG